LALLRKPADAGYLKRIGGGRCLLQNSLTWEALEQGTGAQLLEQLHNRGRKTSLKKREDPKSGFKK